MRKEIKISYKLRGVETLFWGSLVTVVKKFT